MHINQSMPAIYNKLHGCLFFVLFAFFRLKSKKTTQINKNKQKKAKLINIDTLTSVINIYSIKHIYLSTYSEKREKSLLKGSVCPGKKNYIVFSNEHIGKFSALLYGLICTCRCNPQKQCVNKYCQHQ